MKARVYVSMKPSVLDPQGQTIRSALAGLGPHFGSRRFVRASISKSRSLPEPIVKKPAQKSSRSHTTSWLTR